MLCILYGWPWRAIFRMMIITRHHSYAGLSPAVQLDKKHALFQFFWALNQFLRIWSCISFFAANDATQHLRLIVSSMNDVSELQPLNTNEVCCCLIENIVQSVGCQQILKEFGKAWQGSVFNSSQILLALVGSAESIWIAKYDSTRPSSF